MPSTVESTLLLRCQSHSEGEGPSAPADPMRTSEQSTTNLRYSLIYMPKWCCRASRGEITTCGMNCRPRWSLPSTTALGFYIWTGTKRKSRRGRFGLWSVFGNLHDFTLQWKLKCKIREEGKEMKRRKRWRTSDGWAEEQQQQQFLVRGNFHKLPNVFRQLNILRQEFRNSLKW